MWLHLYYRNHITCVHTAIKKQPISIKEKTNYLHIVMYSHTSVVNPQPILFDATMQLGVYSLRINIWLQATQALGKLKVTYSTIR